MEERTLAALALPLVAALGLCWMPASLWLLWRMRAGCRSGQASTATLQAQAQLALFHNSRRDGLTGLASRSAFLETLMPIVAAGRRCTLMVIDLDRFAAINVTHGDTTGDELLSALAKRLRALAGANGHAARLDGDAFALLLDAPEAPAVLVESADRILAALAAPYPAAGQLISLRPRMGVARAPGHGNTAATLLRAAEDALGRAKTLGGTTWCACSDELAVASLARESFRGQLQLAIEKGQILPWYQPIVHLPTGDIARFEVQAQWHHPEMGVLTPDQFMPLADELGFSGHLGMTLLRQVALDSLVWPDTCRFAIGVSAGQVRDMIGFLDAQPGDWQRRMDISRLDLEITETALMHDRALACQLIDTLHAHGARAGLGGFGTGTSNFSLLRDMPFDSIKIDRTFIQAMLHDPRAEACVLSMLWLGCGLGMEMVADGVETAATAERLAELGCTLAQGLAYACSIPAADVAALLAGGEKLGAPMPSGGERRLPISRMLTATAVSSPESVRARA